MAPICTGPQPHLRVLVPLRSRFRVKQVTGEVTANIYGETYCTLISSDKSLAGLPSLQKCNYGEDILDPSLRCLVHFLIFFSALVIEYLRNLLLN